MLKDNTDLITKGTTPHDKSGKGPVNFIKVENIIDGVIHPKKGLTLEEHNGYLKRSQLQAGDILFSIAGTLGRTAIVTPQNLPANTNQALAILRGYKFNSQFLITELAGNTVKDYIRKNPTVGAQPNLSLAQIGNFKIWVPKQNEQEVIGTLFNKVSRIITLYQRKLDLLNQLKQGMLQKLFTDKKQKQPDYRFIGFHDDWKSIKTGKLLLERNEKKPESPEYPLMAFIAHQGVAPKGERYNREALVKNTKTKLYKRTKKGDFIYSSNNLETGSIGLNNYGNASISPVYSIFQPTNMATSDFIGRRFIRKDYINDMIRWRQGVVYGQWKIHESDFLKIQVAVPSINEQNKIGVLLSILDRKIELCQKYLKLISRFKKFLLQQMFI